MEFARLLEQVLAARQNIKRIFFIKKIYFHISSYSQIWLNLLVDDCQFDYITRLENKGCVAHSGLAIDIF
jgi:hypothetical protein